MVCYGTPVSELLALFRLLAESTCPRIKWIVVNNAATEAPAQSAELAGVVQALGGEYLPSQNVGFGAGHNLALAALGNTDAEFHLMVNPDILFGSDVLPELLRAFAQHPGAVRVMPRVRYPDGSEQHLCKLLPSPLDFALRRFLPRRFHNLVQARLDRYELRGLPDAPSEHVPFLSGCFIFSRWQALRAIEGFDDRYFLYMEDVDLCRRMLKEGRLLYWPAVHVTHGYHRGSHVSFKLMLLHLQSCWRYYNRWGWIFDETRKRINRAALASIPAPDVHRT